MITFFKISLIKRKILFLLTFILFSCEKNEIKRNPYLNNVKIDYEINLNLPEFDALRYIGGSKKILNIGLNGVILFNLNNTSYLAWEASCSNHLLKECSKLKLEGVLAKCNCEDYYKRALSIPIHQKIKKTELKLIVNKISNFFNKKI